MSRKSSVNIDALPEVQKTQYTHAFASIQREIYEKFGLVFPEHVLEGVGRYIADYWLWRAYFKGKRKNTPDFFPKPDKGLLLQGVESCQKTELIKNFFGKSKSVEFFYAEEISQVRLDFGSKHLMTDENAKKDVVIADAGSEDDIQDYGNRWTLGNYINWRYRCWEKHGSITIITTHLGASQIGQRYGKATLDHIREMCQRILWDKANT